MRAHLQQLAANTGRTDTRLSLTCPPGCLSVWSAFIQLSRTRPQGMEAGGITFAEIEAWQRLTGVALSPWELDTLVELDARLLGRAWAKEGEP